MLDTTETNIPNSAMQDCFRKYPEIYGAEIADNEDAGRETASRDAPTTEGTPAPEEPELPAAASPVENDTKQEKAPEAAASAVPAATEKTEKTSEKASDVVPTEAHDATVANKGKEQQ